MPHLQLPRDAARWRIGMLAARLSLLLAVWLLGVPAAQAQTKMARSPIISRRIVRLAEMIPGSATDLPPYLKTPQDVYLIVTAGASYTEIIVLANPEASAPALAAALSSALNSTALAGHTVRWSADRYSAAQVTVSAARFGAMRGTSTVPVGALVSGLRRGGWSPHLLLRTPRYASVSLPSPHRGTTNFRWYDSHHLSGQSAVAVSAGLSPLTVTGLTAYLLLVPAAGLLGLWLAGFLSDRCRGDIAAKRRVFLRVSTNAWMGSLVAYGAGFAFLLRLPTLSTLADLWFGSATTVLLTTALPLCGFLFVPILLLARKQTRKRFGADPIADVVPMSDEEKAVRKRVAEWSALPHIAGGVAVGALVFLLPRTSPLYLYIHPVSFALPMLGAALAARVFQKRLDKFTQTTLDDALTWRARQIGQTLGVRLPDVSVEDSSRAAHLAFAAHKSHHITLSRKLVETFTPAETDFVLAHHLACMKRRTGGGRSAAKGLLLLPMLLPIFLIVSPRIIPGIPPLAAFILWPWFFPALMIYFGLVLILPFVLAGDSTKRQITKESAADQDAIAVTGDLAAANSALEKMEVSPAATGLRQSNPAAGDLAQTVEMAAAARLILRRAALQKTAETLRFAPAPSASPSNSPIFTPQAEDPAVNNPPRW